MASVAKNTAFLTGSLVLQKFLSLAYFTILARYLGAASLGQYSFVLSFTTIFGILVDIGITPALTKEVSRDPEHANRVVRAVIFAKLFLGIFAYGTALLVAYLLGYNAAILQLIMVSGIVMVLDGFHLVFYGVLRGLRNLWPESVGMIIGQGASVLAGILGVVFHLPLIYFIAVITLGSLFNVIWSLRGLRRAGIKIFGAFHYVELKRIAVLALPFAIAGIFSRVYSYLDSVLLSYLKGDTAVGYYSVAYKITYAFQFVPLALSAALFPALSAYWVNDKERFQAVAVRSIAYCAMLGLPLTLFIGMLAPELIGTFFSTRYVPSIVLLQVSIAGLFFAFLYFPLGSLMNATKHQTTNTIILGLTMALNAAMNWILIPRFEGLGSAIAQVASNIFLVGASFLVIRQTVVLPRALWLRLGKIIFAGMLMALVLLLKHMIPWPVVAFISMGVFAGVLFFLRAFHAEDIALAVTFLNRLWPRTKPSTK